MGPDICTRLVRLRSVNRSNELTGVNSRDLPLAAVKPALVWWRSNPFELLKCITVTNASVGVLPVSYGLICLVDIAVSNIRCCGFAT